ncbi:uncharacterized protein EV422DRAFT_385016 [Fimicolochytrium jonesii]|uniref:uncharacterized protein n=1 Tax=Fimicolochytrium jonesii TaxID=1396493 RepID=UPI0022FE81C5|nr:uncharacterized protein EV422DRAFT_385016 [Fimicolochytrium jonesii]KAI8822940.1 hypothetical protein EV422DRAFT_385016 [Fimicolochytrium jonesii]
MARRLFPVPFTLALNTLWIGGGESETMFGSWGALERTGEGGDGRVRALVLSSGCSTLCRGFCLWLLRAGLSMAYITTTSRNSQRTFASAAPIFFEVAAERPRYKFSSDRTGGRE